MNLAPLNLLKILLVAALLLPVAAGARSLEIERDGRVMELKLAPDTSAAYGQRIDELLAQIAEEDGPDDGSEFA